MLTPAARDPQVQHERALVARVGLPKQRLPVVAPVAQRIAARRLDLHHLGAEIAELEREHVAGDEAREIEHAHAVERPLARSIEGDRGEGLVSFVHASSPDATIVKERRRE